MPMTVASTLASRTAPKPTVTDTAAPYTTRLYTSRPRLSVPIQNWAPGAFMRAPRMVSSYW